MGMLLVLMVTEALLATEIPSHSVNAGSPQVPALLLLPPPLPLACVLLLPPVVPLLPPAMLDACAWLLLTPPVEEEELLLLDDEDDEEEELPPEEVQAETETDATRARTWMRMARFCRGRQPTVQGGPHPTQRVNPRVWTRRTPGPTMLA
jgi:hypothetical protein